MEKIDYKKELKDFYKPSAKKVTEVCIPLMNFLMVDGIGSPESNSHKEAIEALYSVAYTLKFMIKKSDRQIDYGVLPLEGLWWADDMTDFITDNKSNWLWTMMIMQPELVTMDLVACAINQVKEKKNLPAIEKVRFEPFIEGKCAQTLHVGPFSEEGPTVERVHSFIAEHDSERIGKHHEIYLTDIRRAAPKNWKTIIRQPMS
ncbi:MAG: hypothetical protein OFPII_38900 [Osedax symbiont Rs1]|nr:MAG: hypothetical protein OFPII_38900 [Osedax symbiont Rs1]